MTLTVPAVVMDGVVAVKTERVVEIMRSETMTGVVEVVEVVVVVTGTGTGTGAAPVITAAAAIVLA